jgi:hypothetical protein
VVFDVTQPESFEEVSSQWFDNIVQVGARRVQLVVLQVVLKNPPGAACPACVPVCVAF